MTFIGVLSVLAIAALIPHQGRPAKVGLRVELATFKSAQVWLALSVVMFGFAGVFACYSYIAPLLTQVGGYSPTGLTYLLALLGIGVSRGNLLGGSLADRGLLPSLRGCLAALAMVLGILVFAAHGKATAAVAVFALGLAGFCLGPIMQTYVVEKARGGASLASAAVQAAFNIANSLGAAGPGWAAESAERTRSSLSSHSRSDGGSRFSSRIGDLRSRGSLYRS